MPIRGGGWFLRTILSTIGSRIIHIPLPKAVQTFLALTRSIWAERNCLVSATQKLSDQRLSMNFTSAFFAMQTISENRLAVWESVWSLRDLR